MQKITKRMLSLAVALVMVLSMLPAGAVQVFATEETGITTEEDLAAALSAGGEVKLAGDILVNTEITVPADVTAVLDLNGYAITSGYQTSSTTKHIYPINNCGALTLKDSKGTGSITGRGIYNQNGAVITVNGAKIVAEDWNGGAGIWSYGTGEVYLNDAVITGNTGVVSAEGYVEINGGTYTCYSGIDDDGTQITAPTYNIRAYNGLKITDGTFTSRHGVISIGGGEAVIEDGTYTIEFASGTTSNVVYIYGDTDLTVNGGEFISNDSNDKADSGAAVLVSGSDAKLTVNAGTFVGMNGMVSGNSNTVINGGSFDTVWEYNHYDKIEEFVSAGAVVTVGGETLIKNEDGTATKADLVIKTADELAALRDEVNAGNNYAGKVVVLAADIDLKGSEENLWTPIGTNADAYYFAGTFDGQGHTISNLYIKQGAGYHAAGLFGAIRGTVQNLIIDGAYVESLSSGSATDNGTAVVAGSSYCTADSLIKNVHVKNATVKGNRYVAGIVGYMDGSVIDCSVEDVTIIATPDNLTGSYDNGDKVGGIVGYCNSQSVEISGCELKGEVNITAYRDVAGIVGCASTGVKVNNNTNNAALKITIDPTLCGERDSYNVGEFIGRNTPAENSYNTTGENGSYTQTEVNNNVVEIGAVGYETLDEALEAAKAAGMTEVTVKLLADSTFSTKVKDFEKVTFVGTDRTQTIDMKLGSSFTATSTELVFQDLTVERQIGGTNAWLYHYFYVEKLTYNDCKMVGTFNVTVQDTDFIGCDFYNDDTYGNGNYALWLYNSYSGVEVNVTDCTFDVYERAIKLYGDGYTGNAELNISNTTFESRTEDKTVVEIAYDNDCTAGSYTLNVTNSSYTGFGQSEHLADEDKNSLFNVEGTQVGTTTVYENGEQLWPIKQVNYVAQIGDTQYESLQEALNAAAAGTGEVTVEILQDVDLTNVDWNPVTVSAPGYPMVTVNGNGKTITGLNDMLFASTWAGKSGLIINDLTIKNANIAHDVDDAKGNVGVGAFIGYPQASAVITLNNCHLVDSTVSGGHWTGGLIGMAGGYNGNDGPVFMDLTITGCSVTGSTVTGKGSVGGVIGHGSCAAWTNVVIEKTVVSNNTITSTGSSTNKAGVVMGTIGAAGQATTAAGETKTGGAYVAVTASDNNVTSNGTVITTIYGRQGSSTGMLAITGGTYEKYPIEENVSYAAPKTGYVIAQNDDGTYGVKVQLPEVIITDIKDILTAEDPDLTFALNFAISGAENMTEEYLNDLFETYGDYYVDYVLTISGLNDSEVVFNSNGDVDGYLAGQYDAWSENWVTVPFEDVTVSDGESLYIMEYAAKLMNKPGLRFTLFEVAEIVQNFDCGVYFTPEFLAANPNMTVSLELKVFTEDAEGNKIEDISVATNNFQNGYAAAVCAEDKQTQYYATFAEAYAAAVDGDTIELLADVKLTGKLTMTKSVTIDGNGFRIIADETAVWYTTGSKPLYLKTYKTHLLGINADNITLKDVTLDCNNNAAGINVYCAQDVVFDNISIINATKGTAALTVNGSTLTAKNALTIDTTVTAIDVSNGSGVNSTLGLTVEEGTVFDLDNKTVKFASVATMDVIKAVKADGTPYFAAMDNAYYYTQAQMDSRTAAYGNGLTLLDDVTLNKDLTVSGTLDLNGNDLIMAEGKVIKITGALTINGEGSLSAAYVLTNTAATLTAAENLNVTTTVADYRVVYENGVYKLTEIIYVAQVGNTKYESLQAAVDAAADGDTVYLLTSHEVSDSVVISKDITLDLNGCTVSAANALSNKPVIRVLAGVTVTNGTVDGTTGINSYAFIVGNADTAGVLTIADGTYKGITSAISITNGTANISGGTFSTAHDNEGTDYGAQYLLNCMDAAYKAGTAVYNITGGSFVDFNPESNAAEGIGTNFVSLGYEAVDNGENLYTVQKKEGIVAVNLATGKEYTTVYEALFAAYNTTATIRMIDDSNEIGIMVPAGVALDLNGKTLSVGMISAFGEILDSSADETGLLKTESNVALDGQKTYLPVWNEVDGYFFTDDVDMTTRVMMRQYTQNTELLELVFMPMFDEELKALMVDGSTDNGLTLTVRLTWTGTNGTAEQDFTYKDEWFDNVYVKGHAFNLVINNYADLADLTYTILLVSDTHAEIAGATGSYSLNTDN